MTDLKTYDQLTQGSPEWFAARRGIVTASAVGRLITATAPGATEYDCPECGTLAGHPCKSLRNGEDIKTVHAGRTAAAADGRDTADPILTVAETEESRNLTATLVAERISGITEDHGMTRDMWRGVESEPIARNLYSHHYEQVDEVGFMRLDADWGTLGYSPDGLVGDDGLIEVKAPRAKGQFLSIVEDTIPDRYMAQLQAGLLVSGRKWLDYVSYCGGLHLYVRRIKPDPAWQDVIKSAVTKFELTAEEWTRRYNKAVVGRPLTEHIDLFDVELTLA